MFNWRTKKSCGIIKGKYETVEFLNVALIKLFPIIRELLIVQYDIFYLSKFSTLVDKIKRKFRIYSVKCLFSMYILDNIFIES